MRHVPAFARAATACGLIGVALAASLVANAKWSRADADAFHAKMVQIATHGLAEKRAGQEDDAARARAQRVHQRARQVRAARGRRRARR